MSDKADSQADIETIKRRKKEGIDIPIQKNVQAKTTTTYLEFVRLIHNALPEIDYDEIDISAIFLNRLFAPALVIDSMTGGTPEAFMINARLGELAEKYGFAMGLGNEGQVFIVKSSLKHTP